MALLSERARISRTTLTKVEKGDESVALGIYAAVLYVLGLVENLAQLADPSADAVGRFIDERNLPQRVHLPRSGAGNNAPTRSSTANADD